MYLVMKSVLVMVSGMLMMSVVRLVISVFVIMDIVLNFLLIGF